jgi:hypothetical protein
MPALRVETHILPGYYPLGLSSRLSDKVNGNIQYEFHSFATI